MYIMFIWFYKDFTKILLIIFKFNYYRFIKQNKFYT